MLGDNMNWYSQEMQACLTRSVCRELSETSDSLGEPESQVETELKKSSNNYSGKRLCR